MSVTAFAAVILAARITGRTKTSISPRVCCRSPQNSNCFVRRLARTQAGQNFAEAVEAGLEVLDDLFG